MSPPSGVANAPVTENDAFHSVNQHCLASIINLSERQNVLAAEDICDSNGNKLWAKGKPISREVQEKLLRRKLARPLEMTLTVDSGVMADAVVTECLQLLDEHEELRLLAGSKDVKALLSDFRQITLPGVVKLLLTSAKESGLATYTHSLHTLLVCAGIASRLGMSDHDAQLLLMASLLHDLGEMYISPDYLQDSGTLTPHQWMNVAVHPRVGRTLIEEMTTLHASISVGIGEHHERLDGSGYPGQFGKPSLSKIGRILAVADVASAIVVKAGSEAGPRISLALCIVPEEFDSSVVNVVTKAFVGQKILAAEQVDHDSLKRISGILQRLQGATAAAEALLAQPASRNVADNAAYVLPVLANLGKSMRSTGVIEAAGQKDISDDLVLTKEMSMIIREVEWRMRNLVRNVNLRAEVGGTAADLQQVAPLMNALSIG